MSSMHFSMMLSMSDILCYIAFKLNYLVLAKNDSTFELLAVKTGIKEKEDIEIIDVTEELKNAKIVGNGAYKILMAMKNKSEE